MILDTNTVRSVLSYDVDSPLDMIFSTHCKIQSTATSLHSSLQIFHKEAHPGATNTGRSKEGLSLFGICNKTKVPSHGTCAHSTSGAHDTSLLLTDLCS